MGLTESRQPRRVISSAFLSRPITKIHTTSKKSKYVTHAMGCMQGWRAHMEDAHIMMDTLQGLEGWSFYAVLDGHAGEMAAKVSEELFGATVLYEVLPVHSTMQGVQGALKRAFIKHDKALLRHPDVQRDHSGTTCTSVLITPHYYAFANIGDSRTILCRSNRLEFASHDHKPSLPAERTRIMRAGGCVINGRVDGGLAVSRCFGDFDYKKRKDLAWLQQKVSPEPDVSVVERSYEHDDFLLLACDGIWDVMSNTKVLNFVQSRLLQGKLSLVSICEALIRKCLDLGSRDNMSVIIVLLKGTHAPQQIVVQAPAPKAQPKQAPKAASVEVTAKETPTEVAEKEVEAQKPPKEEEEAKVKVKATEVEAVEEEKVTTEGEAKKALEEGVPKPEGTEAAVLEAEEKEQEEEEMVVEPEKVVTREFVVEDLASSIAHDAIESAISDICDRSVPIEIDQGHALDVLDEDESSSEEEEEEEGGDQVLMASTKEEGEEPVAKQIHHHRHKKVIHRTSSIGPRMQAELMPNKGKQQEKTRPSRLGASNETVQDNTSSNEEQLQDFGLITIEEVPSDAQTEKEEGGEEVGEELDAITQHKIAVGQLSADVILVGSLVSSNNSSTSTINEAEAIAEQEEIVAVLGERDEEEVDDGYIDLDEGDGDDDDQEDSDEPIEI